MEQLMTCTNILKEVDVNDLVTVAILGMAFCIAERITNLDIETPSIKASLKFA